MSKQPVHVHTMSVHICSMPGSVMDIMACFVVLASAQESAKLWLAYLIPAMAHDEQTLEEIAANSAVASRARVHELLGRNDVQVSCVCPCVCACVLVIAYVLLCFLGTCSFVECNLSSRYNGPADERRRVSAKTKLCFTWHLIGEGLNETCDVQVLCRDAVRRGVHLPKAWKSKWSLGAEVLSVDALAHDAVQRVRGEFSLADDVKLGCRPSFTQNIHTHTCTHLST